MSVRLVVTVTAVPGKGDELAGDIRQRNAAVLSEPGCEQFEIFRSVDDPDRLVILERWKDQAALDVHAELGRKRPAPSVQLRVESQREDYIYNRTR
jgi:quinol monooxygenase YgiN